MAKQIMATIAVCLSLLACSGEDGKDGIAGADGRDGIAGINGMDGAPGANGKDAIVNIDSLANVIRKEISSSLWDSLRNEPYVDTVYKNLFDNAFGNAWMDSTRQAIIDSLYTGSYMDSVRQALADSLYSEAYVDSIYKNSFDSAFSKIWLDSAQKALIDSLKEADYDSLYTKLYDSVYNDIYSKSIIRTLYAEDMGNEDAYGAFANHYSLMYEDFLLPDENGNTITIQSPYPIKINNSCEATANQCISKKVMVKTWIPSFTDTATITSVVPANDSIILSPNFNFKDNALLSITSAKKAQRQIEAYAIENNNKFLFYSESKSITIHPMQVFGAEPLFALDSLSQYFLYGVWVTPMADSITKIVAEVAKKLPDGKLLVYQPYYPDASMELNSKVVVEAVYEVLQARNISYVQNTGAASLGQRINYPVETLRKKQGVCIETATLFASVLERIGFQTALIFIPGHVFVGWLTEENGDIIDLIETTSIGNKNTTFVEANANGIDEYNEQIALGNFESGKSVVIYLEDIRMIGIMPNNIP